MNHTLSWDETQFYLDGAPFRLLCGDLHYFRIHPSAWRERLELAKDFGLNTIETYVPWNLHEPKEGTYCFSGLCDLAAFLSLCREMGLFVLLRPSPYICSEWDFGGLPAWLLTKDREMEIRTSDPRYLSCVSAYYEHLIPVFRPFLSTNGGPILAVAVENEYGSFGADAAYLGALRDLLRAGGVDVPLFTTDGDQPSMVTFGSHGGDFAGVNFRAAPGTSARAADRARALLPHNPFYTGEFWAGRSMHVGEPFFHRPPAETSVAFSENLALGGNVSFYMFAGGTNFGFMGGANIGTSFSPRPGTPARYLPHTTSYDEDTCIGEDGMPTEKYFLCRDALDDALGRPRRPRVLPEKRVQALSVELTDAVPLFSQLDALTERREDVLFPRPMEDFGQSFGLILYTQTLPALRGEGERMPLYPEEIRDRAAFFINGAYFATYMRDRGVKTAGAATDGAGHVLFFQGGTDTRVDVLAENLGRVNYGAAMRRERKGMTGLFFGGVRIPYCTVRTLPLSHLSGLTFGENTAAAFTPQMPLFLCGRFSAQPGVDSFVDTRPFGHGYVWVNGFCLGRYDEAGPQYTLYLPGGLLQEENEIRILDLAPSAHRTSVLLLDHMILEGEGRELS